MAEDCSPQRGPSGQPERSESSLTEPDVTDKETIEDQNAVEQQKCGDRRGCNLSKDSAAPTKCPRTDATLRSEKAFDCKQQRRERSSPKAGDLKAIHLQCLNRRPRRLRAANGAESKRSGLEPRRALVVLS
ncbi:hypothetical protein MRX96_050954 [Rhipicephalus microplus]